VQFYRVEVRVLPPEGRGPERTRSVLRRFSHFTKLHANVRCGPNHPIDVVVLGPWLSWHSLCKHTEDRAQPV